MNNEERLLLLEWKNEKAILMQKLQIQEMYIQEAKEREENLRKMNEAFMNSLQANSECVVARLHKSVEQSELERLQETIDSLHLDVKLLQDKVAEKEEQIRNVTRNSERELLKLQQKVIDLEMLRSQGNKENQGELLNQIRDIQGQLKQQQGKHQQELEKQKVQYEAQLRKARVSNYHSQQKKENEEILKLRDENKKLKSQMKTQEQQLRALIKQKQEEVEDCKKQLDHQKRDLEQQLIEQNAKSQNAQDVLKNQIVGLYAILEEEKAGNRQRNQSPSHPTTRIRTNHMQQMTYESHPNNMSVDGEVCVSNFLSRLPAGNSNNISSFQSNKGLEGHLMEIQQKLYKAKKKITTNTEEESSFIRQSIQKIKNRSRNHSISVNETAILHDNVNATRFWDESIEFRTQSSIQQRFT